MDMNKNDENDVEKLLGKLGNTANRNPQARSRGRARFPAQAEAFAKSQSQVPAISNEQNVRHTEWNQNHFERILKTMKLQTKLSILAVLLVGVIAGVAVLASNVMTVSAQQILTRASAAQTLPAQGIWHTRIQVYENPSLLAGDHPGTTTLNDEYLDLATGQFRLVVQDGAGNLTQVGAFDGAYDYSGIRPMGGSNSDPLKVSRVKSDPKQGTKTGSVDPAASAKTLFDDFKNNPNVRVDSQKTWTDGTPVYVLIDDNYQTQAGTDNKTYAGSTRMVFNAKTYQLIEYQTTVGKIVVDESQWLTDEVLPATTTVVWDLSDLKGIEIADEAQPQQPSPVAETLTEQELATHTKSFYVLSPLPSGYTEKIVAQADQPANQDYQFEIDYTGPKDETFSLQAVGQIDQGFIAANFYDGSYQSASGLKLYYSPSNSGGGTSAMLMAPDGNGFLLISSLARPQIQELVDTLVKGQ